MADTLNLLGVIGTWIAVVLAIVALAGIIPAYILYRESQTERYEALSLIDDRCHEYISKGYAFFLLPGKRFFRSIRVPNLTVPPKLDATHAPNSELQLIVKRECEQLDREGSPSLTSWVNFANILQAYGISPPIDGNWNGKLKISGAEALLPVHRSWILLLGIVDRYGRRDDSGLFVDDPPDPDWSAFDNKALYGLSGVLQLIHPGRDRICFRMHSVAHMRSMPLHIPTDGITPRDLFFLYLGYLPSSHGSLYCTAVESERATNFRSVAYEAGDFYKMKVLQPSEVPVRDRRLADEMGIKLPTIHGLSLCESVPARQLGDTDYRGGSLEDVQYMYVDRVGSREIWIRPSDAQSMVLPLLQLDVNAQFLLCGDSLIDLLHRFLPARNTGYLSYMAERGIDALSIEDAEKSSLIMVINKITNHPKRFCRSREWTLALAELKDSLQKLIKKHCVPDERSMHIMTILYLTDAGFKSRMRADPDHIDPEAIFSVNILRKKVNAPAISHFPSTEFDFDFPTVFAGTLEKSTLWTLPLWKVMLASLWGLVKWYMWSSVFSARDLSVFHTGLNRIVYISTQDVPDNQVNITERLQDIIHALKAKGNSNRKKGQKRRGRDDEEEEKHVRWTEDDGNDTDEDDGEYRNDGVVYGDVSDSDDNDNTPDRDYTGYEHRGDVGDSGSTSSSIRTPKSRPPVSKTAEDDTDYDDGEASPLLTPLNADVNSSSDPPAYDNANEKSEELDRSLEDSAAVSEANSVSLTREQQKAKYLSGLEQLLVDQAGDEATSIFTLEFRKVIGPVVLLARSLPIQSLAILLGVPEGVIRRQIEHLQSAIPEPVVSAEPVQLLDMSFCHFILDPDLRPENKFWVDEIETHKTIAQKCLELLSQTDVLRQNACGLEKPGQLRADLNNKSIEGAFPAHVQYACQYWMFHFQKGNCLLNGDPQAMGFLKCRFIHWVEALSLMGCIAKGIEMVDALRSLCIT